MREFIIASERAVEDEAEEGTEELFEFTIGKDKFAARRPSPGQTNVLFSSNNSAESTRLTWAFLRAVLVGDGFGRLRQLVASNVIPPSLLFGGDDLNESGIVESIIGGFSGRPTQSSDDSSPSQNSAGPRSTGRVKSTRSVSP